MKLTIITHLTALFLFNVLFAKGEDEMTGREIQDVFRKMGNSKTRILISSDKIYKPIDLKIYFEKVVTPISISLLKSGNDSNHIKLDDGTELTMLPVASGWFLLKEPKNSPDANAALAYFKFDGQSAAGFVMQTSTGYQFIGKSDSHNLVIKNGQLGVAISENFILFDRLEFDLPKDY
jgi:hypothetical protein